MVRWRASKEVEFLFTLSLLSAGLVLLIELAGPTLSSISPWLARAALLALLAMLSGAYIVVAGMLEPAEAAERYAPPALPSRCLALVLTSAAMVAVFLATLQCGYPRFGVALSGLLAAPAFMAFLGLLAKPRQG